MKQKRQVAKELKQEALFKNNRDLNSKFENLEI